MDNKNEIMPHNEEKLTGRWFWKNGLSIDETKTSTLIICLLVCMIFGGINYIIKGDITNNLTAIIQALIYAIAGVNITNGFFNNGIFNKYGSSSTPTNYGMNNYNNNNSTLYRTNNAIPQQNTIQQPITTTSPPTNSRQSNITSQNK